MRIKASVALNMNFRQITPAVLAAAQHGVGLAGEELLKQAVERVPWDQGTLAGAGAVSTPLQSRDSEPEADVVFDTPYAARLHEHPEYNFSTKSNANAQGKYLENAALENKDGLGDIIANHIRRAGG